MPANLEHSAVECSNRIGKVFIPIPKKGNVKEYSNYHTIVLISHTSKIMLKILQVRLQQYVNRELQMFHLDLEKTEEPEIKLPTSIGSSKEQESFSKTSTSVLLTMPKPLTVWITTNCGKFLKELGISDHLICLLRNVYAGQEATVRTGHKTTNWFLIRKVVRQGCILSPCLFNLYADYIMSNAMLDKSQAGILMEKYQQPQICR